MGKTWALASWLANRIKAKDPTLPLTLFLPSWAVGTFKALDLIAGALAACTGTQDAQFWTRRAESFAKRSSAARPAILLVLDGLNERPLADWRTLLESLRMSPWSDHVATVLTCRPAYWRAEVASGARDSFQLFEVGAYDDSELESALHIAGLQASDLPKALEPLLRLPRYLKLTIQHQSALEQSGDMTVDRLLYEDWKDRSAHKRGLFSDADFRSLLVQLAESNRDTLTKKEAKDLIPPTDEFLTGLSEITTGGILVQNSLGRYVVEPRRLIQGLGLLLADGVRSVADQGESAMREAMASLLEPQADMDRKVGICRSAVTFAVLEPDFPENARSILLEQWIGSRNLSREDTDSFTAYLPVREESYLRLVEHFWTTRKLNHQVQSLFVHAFFRWRDNVQVQQALAASCERWLSYVHPYGYRIMRGRDGQRREELRRKIEGRVDRHLEPGEKFILVEELEVIEDDSYLRLSEPALLLASLFPLPPFIPALRRWALSRSIMGYPEGMETVAWMLRWSDDNLWPSLEAVVGALLDGPQVAQQAAWRLLWACGQEEAATLIERLPKDLFPPTYHEETPAKDPCLSFWRREDCSICAARADLPDRLVALKLAPHALDPDLRISFDLRPRLQRALSGIRADQVFSGPMRTFEDSDFEEIEPVLAAFAPDLLAQSYRFMIRDLPNRTVNNRQVLFSRLGAMVLLIGPMEWRIIREAWDQILQTTSWDDEALVSENFLLTPLLFHAPARAQLDLLLRRPQEAFDGVDLDRWFKKLPQKEVRALAQGLLDSKPPDLQRKVWYLWYQHAATVMESLGAERLVSLLNYDNLDIQSIAANWLLASGSDEVINMAITQGKITPSLTYYMRHFWGRWFAEEMRSKLPYTTLARAIDLGSLSYLLRRGPGDLALYTHDLDRAIRNVTNGRDETLGTGFCKQTLKAIMKRDRKTVEGWVQLAVGQRDIRSSSLIESSHMMLESLCEILLEEDPERGVELFQALIAQRQYVRTIDDITDVDVLAFILFKLPRSTYIEVLLDDWINRCNTDKALFELALAASAVHNYEALTQLIKDGLASQAPVKRAVALGLAGFAIYNSHSASLLESVPLHPEGWLHAVRDRARHHLDRDRWAQEWFYRFASNPDAESSFAAFRLFLCCVDRRYWIWKDDKLRSISLSSVRQQFLTGNQRQIHRAIEENERQFEKRFLGSEIPEGKVRPWLGRYLG